MSICATRIGATGPTGGRPAASCDRPGFSLPELLVVLVVVAILSVLVIPQLEIVKYRMDGSVRGTVMALVTAQRAAVQRQHDVVVAFDTVNGRIRVHEDANSDGTRDPGERTRHIPLDEDVRFGLGAAPPRTALAQTAVAFTDSQDGLPAVRFQRSGSASREGSFYITSDRAMEGSEYAKDTRAVQVDRATGRISWFYYEPPEWKQGF